MMNFLGRLWLVALLMSGAGPLGAAEDETARPKIGLALSGGGARGIAHIGVLTLLEELDIPIDYIAGTSMGAIVGGFYAAGLSPAEIHAVLTSSGGPLALTDSPDRRDLSMRKKELDASFLIPHRVGFNRGELQLPLGVVEGQHLDQILHRVLAKVTDIRDFDQLRIPFRAVATDLVTGAEVVLGQGSLTDSIRASMSVPAVFAPVLIDGRLLVDGGMSNNLPISVVRAMGADIVIAVDISSPLLQRGDLDSVLKVTEQITNFLTRGNTMQQLATLGPRDVLLVPDLAKFGPSDFIAVEAIEAAGYAAAVISRAALLPLAEPGRERPELDPALQARSEQEYLVHFVEVENTSVLNDEIIRSRVGATVGEPLDLAALERSVDQIYGLDLFQLVSYELVTDEQDRTGVRVKAVPRSWGPNYLQFGLEFSDDFAGNSDFSIGAAYTRNALNSLAGELRANVTIGREDLLELDVYQPIDTRASWFVGSRAFWRRDQLNLASDTALPAQVEIAGPGVTVGVGRNFGSTGLVRLDYERTVADLDVLTGTPDILVNDRIDIGEFVLRYRHDSQDNLWFPTRGHLFQSGIRVAREAIGATADYEQLMSLGSFVYTLGKNSVLVNYEAAFSLQDTAPLERWFELGGLGRLSGLLPDQLSGRHMGLASLAVYRQLNEIDLFPVYAGVSLETGNVWSQREAITMDNLRYSGSIFVGADTPVGPLYLAYGYSDNGDNTVYFYLGNPWRASRH